MNGLNEHLTEKCIVVQYADEKTVLQILQKPSQKLSFKTQNKQNWIDHIEQKHQARSNNEKFTITLNDKS